MFIRFVELVLFFMLGAFLTEGIGWAWHRWVPHAGVFGHVLVRILRGRHFDHHTQVYPVKHLSSGRYQKSCELTFHLMGVGFILLLATAWKLDYLSTISCASMLFGALLYGIYGLGRMHDLYHVEAHEVKKIWLFKNKYAWRMYVYLRDYHMIHHYRNKNFAIVLPVFDWLGGTFMHPEYLQVLKKERLNRDNLFPGFNPRLTTTCDKPFM
mgnify:CR=1 FL=1